MHFNKALAVAVIACMVVGSYNNVVSACGFEYVFDAGIGADAERSTVVVMIEVVEFGIIQGHEGVFPVGIVGITGGSAVPIGVEINLLACFNVDAETGCIGVGKGVGVSPSDEHGSSAVTRADTDFKIVIGEGVHVREVDAVKTGEILGSNNSNFAGAGNTVCAGRVDGDGTGSNTLDLAVYRNGCNGFILRGPCNGGVGCILGDNVCNEGFGYGSCNRNSDCCGSDNDFGNSNCFLYGNCNNIGEAAVNGGYGDVCGAGSNAGYKTACINGCNFGIVACKGDVLVCCICRKNGPLELSSPCKRHGESVLRELNAGDVDDIRELNLVQPSGVIKTIAAAVLPVADGDGVFAFGNNVGVVQPFCGTIAGKNVLAVCIGGSNNGAVNADKDIVPVCFAADFVVEAEKLGSSKVYGGGNTGLSAALVLVGALYVVIFNNKGIIRIVLEMERAALYVKSLVKSHFLTGSGSLGDGSFGSGSLGDGSLGDGSFGLANDNRAVIRNIGDGSRGGGACGHVRKSHNIDGESGIAGRIFVDCEIHCEQSAAGGHAVVSIEQTEFNLAEFGFGIQNFHGCAADSVAFGCAVESESFSVILNVHVHSMALKVAAREGYGDRNRVAGLGVDGGNLEHNFALCNCGDGNK